MSSQDDKRSATSKVKKVSVELREMGLEALRDHNAGLTEDFPV